MNVIFRKVSVVRQAFVLNQALTLCRATPSIQHPVWDCVNIRQHRSKPTNGIGSWRYLVPRAPRKKKKEGKKMKPIVEATDTSYGSLNVTVSGYDMTLVEYYSQHIHNLCNLLSIKVLECYALPTKTTEVMLMQEKGTKMYVDCILKTHKRVVQLSSLNTTLCPILMEVVLKNQPEGIQLSMKEHTKEDFQARFKARPELEGLLAQITY
ncbi:39S ribosomal protein L48, mitochondrial [Centropristis striata]|uniref:39S ribosomal protein L48, mitochondrial n=1 Tax=Centropristis striata TaxID=184440 RepID=UPI0027E18771|nr:39S ribosomal protein L48, mitochondrial [Centropristis striata]